MKVMRNTLLLFALIIGVLCTACKFGTQTEYIAVCGDGKKISTGVFVMYELSDALGSVLQKCKDKDRNFNPSVPSDVFSYKSAGVPLEDLVSAEAKNKVREFLGTNALFSSLKLELPTEARERIDRASREFAQRKTSLGKNGVGKDSYIACLETKEKREVLFKYFFGENGEKRPTEEEIASYLECNFVKVQTKVFPYGEQKSARKGEVKRAAQEFQRKAMEMGFSSILLAEEEEREKKEKEEARKAEEAKKLEAKPDATSDAAINEKVQEKKGLAEADAVKTPETQPPVDAGATRNQPEIESREKKLDRIEKASVEILGKKQVEYYYAAPDIIAKLPREKIVVLDVKCHNTFVVLEKLPITKKEYEEKKERMVAEMKAEEFAIMLMQCGKEQGVEFCEDVVEKFKLSNLKL